MNNRLCLGLILFSALLFTECKETPTSSHKCNRSKSFDNVVASRRSVRDYDSSRTVSKEDVLNLVKTAQEAPSWANQQPTKYYVAITPEKVKEIKNVIGDGNRRNTANAPVMIVSTYIKGRSGYSRGNPANEIGDGWGAYDNGLSNAFFILKARERGFDTLIMGVRNSDELRKILAIPEEECIMAVISLGYRASDPTRPDRKPVDDIVRFY